MTKRILATMLAVLMVFSALMLAACTNSTPANTGDQQTAEPTTTDNAGTPAGNDQQTAEPVSEGNFTVPEAGYDGSEVNLTFYHTMGTNLSDVLNLYIEEFNKLYPNIHITSEKIGSYDDVRDQISTEITVGNQPNIAYCYPDHVALYNLAGAVATLDGLINRQIEVARADGTAEILGLTDEQKADFIPGYYAEGTQFGDGLMYTMPFSKSTEVLYYNKTFFDANRPYRPHHLGRDGSYLRQDKGNRPQLHSPWLRQREQLVHHHVRAVRLRLYQRLRRPLSVQ